MSNSVASPAERSLQTPPEAIDIYFDTVFQPALVASWSSHVAVVDPMLLADSAYAMRQLDPHMPQFVKAALPHARVSPSFQPLSDHDFLAHLQKRIDQCDTDARASAMIPALHSLIEQGTVDEASFRAVAKMGISGATRERLARQTALELAKSLAHRSLQHQELGTVQEPYLGLLRDLTGPRSKIPVVRQVQQVAETVGMIDKNVRVSTSHLQQLDNTRADILANKRITTQERDTVVSLGAVLGSRLTRAQRLGNQGQALQITAALTALGLKPKVQAPASAQQEATKPKQSVSVTPSAPAVVNLSKGEGHTTKRVAAFGAGIAATAAVALTSGESLAAAATAPGHSEAPATATNTAAADTNPYKMTVTVRRAVVANQVQATQQTSDTEALTQVDTNITPNATITNPEATVPDNPAAALDTVADSTGLVANAVQANISPVTVEYSTDQINGSSNTAETETTDPAAQTKAPGQTPDTNQTPIQNEPITTTPVPATAESTAPTVTYSDVSKSVDIAPATTPLSTTEQTATSSSQTSTGSESTAPTTAPVVSSPSSAEGLIAPVTISQTTVSTPETTATNTPPNTTTAPATESVEDAPVTASTVIPAVQTALGSSAIKETLTYIDPAATNSDTSSSSNSSSTTRPEAGATQVQSTASEQQLDKIAYQNKIQNGAALRDVFNTFNGYATSAYEATTAQSNPYFEATLTEADKVYQAIQDPESSLTIDQKVTAVDNLMNALLLAQQPSLMANSAFLANLHATLGNPYYVQAVGPTYALPANAALGMAQGDQAVTIKMVVDQISSADSHMYSNDQIRDILNAQYPEYGKQNEAAIAKAAADAAAATAAANAANLAAAVNTATSSLVVSHPTTHHNPSTPKPAHGQSESSGHASQAEHLSGKAADLLAVKKFAKAHPEATDAAYIAKRLLHKTDFTLKQISGILGNPWQESGGNGPTIRFDANQTEGGSAKGAFQWEGPRFDALVRFADERGTHWTDPETQVDFMIHELHYQTAGGHLAELQQILPQATASTTAWEALHMVNTPADAARVFELTWERAGTPMMGHRINGANWFFNKIGHEKAKIYSAARRVQQPSSAQQAKLGQHESKADAIKEVKRSLVKTAVKFAKLSTDFNDHHPKASYRKARTELYGPGINNPWNEADTDCSVFIRTVVIESGADPDWKGNSGAALNYAIASQQWTVYNVHKVPGGIQDGDILANNGHIFMYVGPQKNGNTVAEASWDEGNGGHVPEIDSKLYTSQGGQDFQVIRYTGK